MTNTDGLKRRLERDPAGDSTAGEDGILSPSVGDSEDVKSSQVDDLLDQDPDTVPNRLDAPPPPTTERAGFGDEK